MAMKNVNLGLFFLGEDKGDNLLETQQAREENGTAVDSKGDGEAEHPVDIQLLDKEGDQSDGGKESDDVEPIPTTDFQLQDALGEEVLQESRNGLHAEAGAGGTHGIEAWDDHQVEQNVDDHASRCHEVELLEATVGGEQGAENVGR